MIWLPVEFNDLDEQGRLLVLAELAPESLPITPAERVYLFDDEGNSCWGTVSAVGDGLIRVDADWDTWRSGGTVETGVVVGGVARPNEPVAA